MFYKSTRSTEPANRSSAEVIKEGLAADGGLFVPESIPTLTLPEIEALCRKSYPERAADILSRFLTDYTPEELLEDCRIAYRREIFPGGAAPLVGVRSVFPLEILELWHGPTAAFKDMALQIMPRLLSRALVKTGETRDALILVATSGDTGKAALEGYRDVERMRILVFYPSDGVSSVQKLQMATQQGANLEVCAIHGNFDDAQNGVKSILNSPEMTTRAKVRGTIFSSANSINWGRLVPQTVYYVSAYCDLINAGRIKPGSRFNVCVPTGNFGNIFAAFIAKQMGLPIERLICASNSNNVLTDFLATGTYDRNRPFHTTMSPSMDILVSSNLERLLFALSGQDDKLVADYMQQLNKHGGYTVSDEIKAKLKSDFYGGFCSEEETSKVIAEVWKKYNYLIDPHTAVAYDVMEKYRQETGDTNKTVFVSTASPFKFCDSVLHSLGVAEVQDGIDALDQLSQTTNRPAPVPLASLRNKAVRFTESVDKEKMEDVVLEMLK